MNSFVRTTTVLAAVTLGVAGCTTKSTSSGVTSPSGSISGSGSSSASGSVSGSPSGSPTGAPSDSASASASASGSPSASPSATTPATTPATPTVPPFTDDAGKTFPTTGQAAGAVVTSNGIKAQVLVHPDSVVKGSKADLGKAVAPSGRVPVYVTVTYTNAGTTTLQFPSLGTDLHAAESGGGQAVPFAVDVKVPQCISHNPPDAFKPGGTFTDCQIFLVHKGTTVKQLSYRPGDRAGEITWTVAK